MQKFIPYFILMSITFILYIIYHVRKVKILQYISRWGWGVRIIKKEYFNVLLGRQKKRVKSLKRAIEYAKEKKSAENLKQYVIELEPANYFVGTMREFGRFQKDNKIYKKMWPPRDAVFQTK